MIEENYARRLEAVRAATARFSQSGPTSSYQPSYSLPFQRWYKFKEAYSPQLLFEILGEMRRPRHICDPFGGSGTTALVAQYLGLRCSTIELNPFLCDIIRAKLASYNHRAVDEAFSRVIKGRTSTARALTALRLHAPATLVEPGLNGRFIFSKPVISRVLRLRESIRLENDPSIRRLLAVTLASILVSVSNIVVNGKGRRYRRNWSDIVISPQDVDTQFAAAYEDVRADLQLQGFKTTVQPRVIEGDARLASELIDDHVDMAVFSPPYPNSFDYTDIYNIELWVMGYFRDASANRALRLRTLQSHVQVRHPDRTPVTRSRTLARTVERMRNRSEQLWNPRLPGMISGYFADLETVIQQLGNQMHSGGVITCIVGDSLYAGVLVDIPAILTELFSHGRIRVTSAKTLRTMTASAQHDWKRTLKESLITLAVARC